MATDKKAMTVYVPIDLYKRIEDGATRDGRSISNYVERLLWQTIDFAAIDEIMPGPKVITRRSRSA
jgi:hypothetical protein